MQKIKKSTIISTLLFILLFTACSDEQEKKTKLKKDFTESQIVLKFSHVVNQNTPKGMAAIFFEKRLEELSKGKIDVQIYPSSQLYKDSTVLKALKLDSVQMAAPSFSKFGKIVPQLSLFDLPFLFDDINEVHKVQDGVVGQKLKAMLKEKGYIALNFWDNGFKQFTSSKNEIIYPNDAKSQRFRIMSSKVIEEQFKSVKAVPQVMPFSEVYAGLQQGVIDGQENTISNIYTKKFYEIQKYLTISNHGYLGYLVVMSEEFWNTLTPKLQDNIKQAMNEATKKEREYARQFNEKDLEKIKVYAKETGKLKIVILTKEQKMAWKKAVSIIYPDFYDNKMIGKDLIDKALNIK